MWPFLDDAPPLVDDADARCLSALGRATVASRPRLISSQLSERATLRRRPKKFRRRVPTFRDSG